jgi:hypothetical protein
VPDEIITGCGGHQAIRCDNGPELTSRHFLAWALDGKIELRHIQPGKPTQNAHGGELSWQIARRVSAGQLVCEPIRRTQEG